MRYPPLVPDMICCICGKGVSGSRTARAFCARLRKIAPATDRPNDRPPSWADAKPTVSLVKWNGEDGEKR